MKKNLTFKLGLFCAALVLVATCFVTNAWAKYTKSVSAGDSARVAKFVVEANHNDKDMMHEEFTLDIFTTAMSNIYKDSSTNNVNVEKLIAPGSHGQFQVQYVSNSEVAVQFEMSAVVANSHNIPLQWSLDESTWNSSLDTVLDGATKVFQATNGASELSETINVYWKWDYEGDNVFDTGLGENTLDLFYSVTLTVTATQVQPA